MLASVFDRCVVVIFFLFCFFYLPETGCSGDGVTPLLKPNQYLIRCKYIVSGAGSHWFSIMFFVFLFLLILFLFFLQTSITMTLLSLKKTLYVSYTRNKNENMMQRSHWCLSVSGWLMLKSSSDARRLELAASSGDVYEETRPRLWSQSQTPGQEVKR